MHTIDVAGTPLHASDLRALGSFCLTPASDRSDEWAADHYTVFTHEAMPVASVYLASDGLLGGLTTAAAIVETGHPVDPSVPADHAGMLLAEAARQLEEEGSAAALEVVRVWLSSWIPLCTEAIRRLDVDKAFHAWATSVHDLVACACAEPGASPYTPRGPEGAPENILDDEKTGLAGIGQYIATPARSGLFLSHNDIRTLSRTFALPTGFGSRARSVEGLFRSAVSYERLADVCLALESHIDQVEALWYGFDCDVPAVRPSIWSGRLVQTRQTLRRLATESDR